MRFRKHTNPQGKPQITKEEMISVVIKNINRRKQKGITVFGNIRVLPNRTAKLVIAKKDLWILESNKNFEILSVEDLSKKEKEVSEAHNNKEFTAQESSIIISENEDASIENNEKEEEVEQIEDTEETSPELDINSLTKKQLIEYLIDYGKTEEELKGLNKKKLLELAQNLD